MVTGADPVSSVAGALERVGEGVSPSPIWVRSERGHARFFLIFWLGMVHFGVYFVTISQFTKPIAG